MSGSKCGSVGQNDHKMATSRYTVHCLNWSQTRGLGEKGIVQNHSIEPVKKINARESIKENKKENLAKRTGNFGSQIPQW